MDELYQQIKALLETEVSEIRWIDQDEGQLDNYPTSESNTENKPPLSYPAALINVEDNVQYRSIAGGKQIATNNFTIKLAFKVFEGAHKNVPNSNYFAHYVIVKKATEELVKGLKQCRRLSTTKRSDKIDPLLHTLRFRINYLDTNT